MTNFTHVCSTHTELTWRHVYACTLHAVQEDVITCVISKVRAAAHSVNSLHQAFCWLCSSLECGLSAKARPVTRLTTKPTMKPSPSSMLGWVKVHDQSFFFAGGGWTGYCQYLPYCVSHCMIFTPIQLPSHLWLSSSTSVCEQNHIFNITFKLYITNCPLMQHVRAGANLGLCCVHFPSQPLTVWTCQGCLSLQCWKAQAIPYRLALEYWHCLMLPLPWSHAIPTGYCKDCMGSDGLAYPPTSLGWDSLDRPSSHCTDHSSGSWCALFVFP